MAQDPWKRAHQIKRLRDQQARDGSPAGKAGPPLILRRKKAPLLSWAIALLLLGGLFAAWYYRDLWLPRLREEVVSNAPEPVRKVAQKIPEKQVRLDAQLFDRGLGMGLRLDADYLELLAAMRDSDPGWKLTSTGVSSVRLSAPGAVVSAVGGRVQNYELQIDQIYASEAWRPWLKGLQEAQLSPELRYTALSGDEEAPVGESKYELKGESFQRSDGWVTPVYILRFIDNKLRSLELAIKFGVAEPAPEAAVADPGDGAGKTEDSQPGG